MPRSFVWSALSAAVLLVACSGEPDTGPVEIKWDRDTCERCRMVLSDRMHAAQIRGGASGEKRRVYKFDDIGGAILWLEDKPWKDDAATEIWVTDFRDGHWIDGRKAFYLSGQLTPMDFGIGAQDQPVEGSMKFEALRAYLLERGRRTEHEHVH